MNAKGLINRLPQGVRPGQILGMDGQFIIFDEYSLQGLDSAVLLIGDWVEYEKMNQGEAVRAIKITPMIQRADE